MKVAPDQREHIPCSVEWIETIPSHWSKSKLGFVASVKARLGWKGLKAEEYLDDGFVFLSTPNIKGREIDFQNVNFISEFRYLESPEIILNVGDVLIAKDGSTLGTCNLVRTLPRPATVNSSIAVIRPQSGLNGLFLYYFFSSHFFQSTIVRMKGGMGVPHLFQADLRKFDVLLPPLAEQHAIAEFLDRKTAQIDGVIAKKLRMIDLLHEKRQALISEAVTKGLDPDVPTKDSGIEWLGRVPKHWEVIHLKRALASAEYGIGDSTEPTGQVIVLRMGNVQDGEIRMDDLAYVNEVPTEMLLRKNDLLFNRTNSLALIGKVGIFRGSLEDRVSFASYLVRFRTKPHVDPEYLNFVLNRQEILEVASRMSLPAIGQANLNPNRYGYLRICIPPLAEQLRIVEKLKTETTKIRGVIERIESQITKLREYRQTLISAAVTGQIDVTTEGQR